VWKMLAYLFGFSFESMNLFWVFVRFVKRSLYNFFFFEKSFATLFFSTCTLPLAYLNIP